MFPMRRQSRLRWLGQVRKVKDRRIPKDILHGELVAGKCNFGRPELRNRDMKELNKWEELAMGSSKPLLKLVISAFDNERRLQK